MMSISYTKKSLTSYAQKIGAAWHRAAQSIIEVGQLLNEAESKLGPPGFRQLRRQLEDDNVMSGSTISKLKMIAKNSVLTAPERVQFLPRSCETLYNLARWEDDKLVQGFSDGTISPEMQQRESRMQSAATQASALQRPAVLFQVEYSGNALNAGTKRKLRSIIDELSSMKGITVTKKMDI